MKSVWKKIFLLLFSLMSLSISFSQESDEEIAQEAGRMNDAELEESDVNIEKKVNTKDSSLKDDVKNQKVKSDPNANTSASENSVNNEEVTKYKTLPYGFYIGAKFVTNKIDYEEKNIPFVAVATAGFEYEYKVKYFSLQPSFDLSFMHYLWTGSMACHAENENRTAFTIAFTAELPFMLNFDIQRWNIAFGTSFAFLARVSALDLGVKANESVVEGGLTAKDEVATINKYHWQSGRFFYPAIRLKTEYTLENGWKAGVLFSTYLPIFNAWSEKIANTTTGKVPFIHDGIFTLAIIIHPGKKLQPSH